jgi:hypothetical protein
LTEVALHKSAIDVCLGIIRIEADGDIIICDGGEVLTELALRISAIVVCIGIIRIEADGDIIICDGGEVLTELALRISAIVATPRLRYAPASSGLRRIAWV